MSEVIQVATDRRAPTQDRLRAASVLAVMDGLNQKDEETANTNFRLDAGKPTQRVAGVVVMPPPMPPE